jgi:prepilin-type N-terminal cleavage/methylation domain-containing protein
MKMKTLNVQQSGFTLVEIAIVLVIIGLLLGGILKGQELINSARVKNLAQDFKTVPLYLYGYQDRFKAIPGDDPRASTNLPMDANGNAARNGNGNGVIDGPWNDPQTSSSAPESVNFWQHVRLANFASGSSVITDANYLPTNVEGGRVGIQSGAVPPFSGLRGSFIFCSASILGKYAKQLDVTLDDGNTASGSMMIGPAGGGPLGAGTTVTPEATAAVDDSKSYTVCLAF